MDDFMHLELLTFFAALHWKAVRNEMSNCKNITEDNTYIHQLFDIVCIYFFKRFSSIFI